MKVSELIEKLKEFDEDLFVVVPGYEMGWDDVRDVSVLSVRRDIWGDEDAGHLGEHEEIYPWNDNEGHENNAVRVVGRHGNIR